MSSVVGEQNMHLDLVKDFVECGKLKQARRLVEVIVCLMFSCLKHYFGHDNFNKLLALSQSLTFQYS